MSCTAHDTRLPVCDWASQGCLLVIFILFAHLPSLAFLLLDLLYHRLVDCELDGIGSWPSTKVIHTSLQSLGRRKGKKVKTVKCDNGLSFSLSRLCSPSSRHKSACWLAFRSSALRCVRWMIDSGQWMLRGPLPCRWECAERAPRLSYTAVSSHQGSPQFARNNIVDYTVTNWQTELPTLLSLIFTWIDPL